MLEATSPLTNPPCGRIPPSIAPRPSYPSLPLRPLSPSELSSQFGPIPLDDGGDRIAIRFREVVLLVLPKDDNQGDGAEFGKVDIADPKCPTLTTTGARLGKPDLPQ